MEPNVPVSYSNNRKIEGPYVLLEQEEYEKGTGLVTTLDLVRRMSDKLYDTEESREVECNHGEQGEFGTVVNAYPSEVALDFDFGVTHGTPGPAVVQRVEVRELLQFRLTDEQQTRYPVLDVISVEWYNNQAWDEEGRLVTPPTLTVDRRYIDAGSRVYGTVEIRYRVYREVYAVVVPPRTDTLSNIYDSVAYARWDGGVVMLDLEPPKNVEDQERYGGTCMYSSIVSFGPDEPIPPTVSGKYNEILIDYCTQKEKR